jgi:hypothetical protein
MPDYRTPLRIVEYVPTVQQPGGTVMIHDADDQLLACQVKRSFAEALVANANDLPKAISQRNDFHRQLTAEREGRILAERIVDEVRARNRELEALDG